MSQVGIFDMIRVVHLTLRQVGIVDLIHDFHMAWNFVGWKEKFFLCRGVSVQHSCGQGFPGFRLVLRHLRFRVCTIVFEAQIRAELGLKWTDKLTDCSHPGQDVQFQSVIPSSTKKQRMVFGSAETQGDKRIVAQAPSQRDMTTPSESASPSH
eukprot:3868448-Karenia_brevis.AAC.1